MNSLYTSNKAFFSQLFLGIALFGHSLYGMHFNGTPIDALLNADQTLTFTPAQQKNRFMLIKMQDNNLTIGTGDINGIVDLKENFNFLKSQKAALTSMKRKESLALEAIDIYNEAAYFKTDDLTLQSQNSIYCGNCLFNSQKVDCSGDKIQFINSFLIKPKELYLSTTCPNSKCIFLRIIFDEEATDPTTITGNIDFSNNITPKAMVLTNVLKVIIMFAPKAWK